jgi:hypothetical protein
MQSVIKKTLTLALLITAPIYGCLGADAFVGFWRSEPLYEKTVEYYNTIEFLKDGSCHKSTSINFPGHTTTVPMTGTYQITDTNHILVELVFNPLQPAVKTPFHLSYSFSNDVLYLQSFDGSGTINKYERKKN